MSLVTREQVGSVRLPGRTIQSAVGKNAFSDSRALLVGFAHHSAESRPLEPHQHAEEVMHILDAGRGWVCFVPAKYELGERIAQEAGTGRQNPPLE